MRAVINPRKSQKCELRAAAQNRSCKLSGFNFLWKIKNLFFKNVSCALSRAAEKIVKNCQSELFGLPKN